MKKRFIICLDKSTKEQEKVFIDFLRANSLSWWHWLSNTWLISNSSGELNSTVLRDKLKEIFVGVHCMVFEISATNDTWSGFGPKSENKDMFKWINTNWKKD